MAKFGQRKCLNCEEFFDPDHRNQARQHYCAKPECRLASKAASQAAWLVKPENTDYFRDPSHVARVQAWRSAHPGYSRKRTKTSLALQDPLSVQAIDFIEESPIRGEMPESPPASALQDVLNPLSPILAGLIAHLFSLTLQDDIDQTSRRLVQLGTDIINRSHHEDHQASASPTAIARSP
jgi:hypothetical protein